MVGVLVGSTATFMLGLFLYVRWTLVRSFISWDGNRITVREGLGMWSVATQKGLQIRAAKARVTSGHCIAYVWILDRSCQPLMRLRLGMWPEERLRRILEQLGTVWVPQAELEVISARQLRRENRQLVPFWVAHPTFTAAAMVIPLIGLLTVLMEKTQ